MWFTLAVEPDSHARPRGHAGRAAGADRRRVDPPAADAQALQDPHGPGDVGRHRRRWPRPPQAVEPVELEPQPYDELDMAVIRATQGDLPVVAEPYADGRRASSGMPRRRAARPPARAWSSAACCAASPRSSSTAAPASAPTAWASGRCPTTRSSRSARGWPPSAASRHCYQRPTYADWPYQLFTMAHGRSKEECDAILDAIARRGRLHRGPRDALLLDRVQEDPPPLLHRRLQGAGSASTQASRLSLGHERLAHRHPLGRAVRARAAAPARRRQLAGARDARDRPRPDLHRPRRRRRARRRRRQPLRRLRLLVGPADPRPRASRRSSRPSSPRPRARHDASARRPPAEVDLADEVARRMPVGRDAAHDLVGHRGVDERDPPRARRDRPRRSS